MSESSPSPSRPFFGAEQTPGITAVTCIYPGIRTPVQLYDALAQVWCAETCTPRMRADWTPENLTLGQCAITSFLAQDIFGGRVFGIPLPDGGFHCFNVVDGRVFDLTSAQFGNEKLAYENQPEQFREIHFAREEKHQRYELLKKKLLRRQQEACETLLAIDVICEKALRVSGNAMDIVMIPFSGTATGSGFRGRIVGPGVDTQKIGKDGSLLLSARYMLEGQDAGGTPCRIFIENQGSWNTGFVPKLVTDSAALAHLETEALCATIQGTEKGVLVRVFRRS